MSGPGGDDSSPRRRSDYPFAFNPLSVKGKPGVNQIPHPDDTRALTMKGLPGTFQLPNSARLTKDEQNQVNDIVRGRQFPRKGPTVSGLPVKTYSNRARSAQALDQDQEQEEDVKENIVMGEDKTEVDTRDLPEYRKPPMPKPTDSRASSHGRAARYGNRGNGKRARARARINPKKQSKADRENPNRRWEYEYLIQQQVEAIEHENTKPSPHRYRYICPQPGCGVSANDAREISRHYNWSSPPLHPGLEHVPSRTLQGVLYKDWLKDEDLYATKYATSNQEFYEELAKEDSFDWER
ncbi:hypothetical protein DV736_g4707, partial [Chaetothyriales sp. CBS 134916]